MNHQGQARQVSGFLLLDGVLFLPYVPNSFGNRAARESGRWAGTGNGAMSFCLARAVGWTRLRGLAIIAFAFQGGSNVCPRAWGTRRMRSVDDGVNLF